VVLGFRGGSGGDERARGVVDIDEILPPRPAPLERGPALHHGRAQRLVDHPRDAAAGIGGGPKDRGKTHDQERETERPRVGRAKQLRRPLRGRVHGGPGRRVILRDAVGAHRGVVHHDRAGQNDPRHRTDPRRLQHVRRTEHVHSHGVMWPGYTRRREQTGGVKDALRAIPRDRGGERIQIEQVADHGRDPRARPGRRQVIHDDLLTACPEERDRPRTHQPVARDERGHRAVARRGCRTPITTAQ